MFDLARAGDPQLLRYVEAGVSANLVDPQGNTFLMLAAYHGHADLVAGLARLGADPDRLNDRGQSPLSGAIFKAEEGVVRALVAAGADPNAGSPSGRATAATFDSPLAELLPPPT